MPKLIRQGSSTKREEDGGKRGKERRKERGKEKRGGKERGKEKCLKKMECFLLKREIYLDFLFTVRTYQ